MTDTHGPWAANHQRFQLTQARIACPHLDATTNHVTEFARILTNQGGNALTSG
jgi:hypothetical protein